MSSLLSKFVLNRRHHLKFLKNVPFPSRRGFSSNLDLPKRKKSNFSRSPITWKSVAVCGGVGGAMLLLLSYVREEKNQAIERERKRSLGKAAIGGSFELVDHTNKLRKSEEFLGQWLLLYFGFTHCPDICPDELEKMAKVVDIIDAKEDLPNLQPIFISVDPLRDSPEIIAKYLSEFSQKFIGFTGTEEQIAKTCKTYRVYFSAGPKDKDSDYIVDHTIIMYLIDPDGQFVDYYGQNRNAEETAESIQYNIAKYEHNNRKSVFSKIVEKTSPLLNS